MACPHRRRSASSLQQPCSLPTLSGSLCPALGQPLAAPGQRSLGSGVLRVGSSILGGASASSDGTSASSHEASAPSGSATASSGSQGSQPGQTCLVPSTECPARGHPQPTARGARLSPAQGQIGSVPPARREIRLRAGSCWCHMLN